MQHVETFRLNICLASALTASESVVTSIRCMQFSDQKGLQGIPQQKGSSVHGQHCRIPFMLSISLQASQLDIRSCSHMEAGRSSLMPVFSCSLSLYSLPPSLSLSLSHSLPRSHTDAQTHTHVILLARASRPQQGAHLQEARLVDAPMLYFHCRVAVMPCFPKG